MPIQVDATGTALDTTGTTSVNYSGITVGSGANRALIVFVAWGAGTNPGAVSGATWDSGGSNQAMTLLESNLTGPFQQIYGLVNPTPGNKTLNVSWTNSANSVVNAQSYTGVLQTGGTTTWPNGTTSTATSTAPSLAVTSAAGHLPVTLLSTGATPTISAPTQTQIWLDNAGANVHSLGQNSAPNNLSGTSITFAATLSASTLWMMTGVDMLPVPPIGGIQLAGNANAGPAEVELNNLALRNIFRPNDFTFLGSFSVTNQNTVKGTAGAATGGWFGMYWPQANSAALIKKLSVSAVSSTAGTTGPGILQAVKFTAVPYSVANSYNSTALVYPLTNKLRIGEALSAFEFGTGTSNSTAMLTGAGVVYEPNPIGAVVVRVGGLGLDSGG